MDEEGKDDESSRKATLAEEEDTNIVPDSPHRLLIMRFRQNIQDIVNHPAFDVIVIVLILLNTVVLATYHHGIDAQSECVLDSVNLVSEDGVLVKFVLY